MDLQSMTIPPFLPDGYLPEGLYLVSEAEARDLWRSGYDCKLDGIPKGPGGAART